MATQPISGVGSAILHALNTVLRRKPLSRKRYFGSQPEQADGDNHAASGAPPVEGPPEERVIALRDQLSLETQVRS